MLAINDNQKEPGGVASVMNFKKLLYFVCMVSICGVLSELYNNSLDFLLIRKLFYFGPQVDLEIRYFFRALHHLIPLIKSCRGFVIFDDCLFGKCGGFLPFSKSFSWIDFKFASANSSYF
jgi:hypothetical protein